MNGTSRPRSRTIASADGTAEARHRVIGDHQIPVVLIERRGQRLFVVDAGVVGLVSALPQVFDEECRVVSWILNQQQPQWFHAAGYRAIQAFVSCSAVWSRASNASASFSVLYLPTRTRKRAVGVPFTGSITNAG